MSDMQEMLQERMRKTITKPVANHANIQSTRASQAEIEDRYRKAKVLEELGISISRFSEYESDEHEDPDELQAIILVNEGREIPEELRARLIQKQKQISGGNQVL